MGVLNVQGDSGKRGGDYGTVPGSGHTFRAATMNIYYREERLCGGLSGNGEKQDWIDRLFERPRRARTREAFPLDDINRVLHNHHNSFGCSVKAPMGNIMWRSEALHYTLPCDVEAYIPRHISFTDGQRDFYLVVIGDACELRVWPDSRLWERQEAHWFSHQPVTDYRDFKALKVAFDALLVHVRKEDRLAGH